MAFTASSSVALSGRINVFEVRLEKETNYEFSLSTTGSSAEVKVQAYNYEDDIWETIKTDSTFYVPAVKMHLTTEPPRYKMRFIISFEKSSDDSVYTFTLDKV